MATRKVYDGEPSHSERDSAREKHSLIVRPAMADHAAHAVKHTGILSRSHIRFGRLSRHESCNAAHAVFYAASFNVTLARRASER